MFTIISILFLICLRSAKPDSGCEATNNSQWCWYSLMTSGFTPFEKWMEIPLDHFDVFNGQIWKMRYFENNLFHKPEGPIFIEVGGEYTINGRTLFLGPLSDLARKYHGVLIETEHRYYGKSLPFKNFTTKTLKYLQFEQALEDLAYFIETYKSQNKLENATVVLHGCSYSAMLATWMRLKFPHLVDVVYASSSTIGMWLEYPDFFKIIYNVYADVSKECADTIRDGFNQIYEMQESEDGRQQILEVLSNAGCASLGEDENIIHTFLEKFITMDDKHHIEHVSCSILTTGVENTEPYERMSRYVATTAIEKFQCNGGNQAVNTESAINNSEEGDVNKTEQVDVDENKIENEEAAEKRRNRIAWRYQICTEMGTLITASKSNPSSLFIRDETVRNRLKSCAEFFNNDMEITERIVCKTIEKNVRRYGGIRPPVSKVLTVQGTRDPWIALSYLGNYTEEAPVFVYDGAQCFDMKPAVLTELLSENTQEMKELRKSIDSVMSKWIDEVTAR